MSETNDTICTWANHDPEGAWVTDCENLFLFNEGTPSENGFRYCPYCGSELAEVWLAPILPMEE